MRTPHLALLLVLFAAGCGGGGGHHSGSSSGSSVTFAANSIVYGVPNGTDADFSVEQLSPSGGTPTTVVSDVSGSIFLFAADPSRSGRYALAADPTGAGTYGIYLSKNLALSGATQLVAAAYVAVGSLSVTPDGGHVLYTATTTSGTTDLFVVPTAGGTPVDLGAADAAAIAPDGDTIAFVAPPGGEGSDAVFTRSLAAGASGAVVALTTDGLNHALPAFSPDGTKLAYWTLADGANVLSVRTLSGGATVSVPGVSAVEPQGEAFGSDGTTLALVGQSGTGGIIATAPVDGSAAPTTILSNANLLGDYGFVWTDANGRAVSGVRSASAASRARKRG